MFQNGQDNLTSILTHKGVSRRDFLKFCTAMTAALALPLHYVDKVAAALEDAPKRTPVVWLEFQDCAGCSEAFLRASRPTAAEVILDILSVDYHETIMAASGHLAEEAKKQTVEAGGHLVIVEGSIPTKENGIYCTIGGRTSQDILAEATENAIAVISVGTCASFGGIPKAMPNPTGAVGVTDLVTHIPVLNLPGCPVNVVNLTATVVHFLTFGELPKMDDLNRPLFAYGALIHDNCERRGHFDANQFVKAWGDEGHRNGWCLYEMGCKGPVAYHNCPTVRYNDGMNWPIGSGHGCIACSEPDFWEMPKYEPVDIQIASPPATYPPVEAAPETMSPGGAATIGAVAGLVVGGVAGAVAVSGRSGSQEQAEEQIEA